MYISPLRLAARTSYLGLTHSSSLPWFVTAAEWNGPAAHVLTPKTSNTQH